MKKIILAILVLLPLTGFAHASDMRHHREIMSYNQLVKAIEKGKTIGVSIDFSKCVPQMQVEGFYAPKSVIISKKSVLFSDKHFTLNSPGHKGNPVIEYVHYTINPQNQLILNTTIVALPSYEKLAEYPTTTCQLTKAAHIYLLGHY
jgi:hypothetical protein